MAVVLEDADVRSGRRPKAVVLAVRLPTAFIGVQNQRIWDLISKRVDHGRSGLGDILQYFDDGAFRDV
jgi:hypothetical protein